MSTRSRRVTRRFPDYGWAWPGDSLDLLLKAALLPERDAALAAASNWLDRHDIDSASFRDHRLLGMISSCFGKAIAGHAAYPRILGLRRQMWTRSRMAVREAQPALKAMAAEGIPLLLIKGAARIARQGACDSGRVAHDIDVVVGPGNILPAHAVLQRHGWQASSGISPQFLATQLQSIQSMNFFFGSFGDIDLHRDAYPAMRDDVDEERLWRQAEGAEFHGVPVRVPSAADTAVLAIAHGTLAAHVHSDWLVDCAEALRSNGFSWSAFDEIVERRDLAVPAAIVLSYLAQEILVDVPAEVLQRVVEAADRTAMPARLGFLLQAKPRTDMSQPLHAARWLAKKARMRQERKSRDGAVTPPVLRGRRVRGGRVRVSLPSTDFATSHPLDLAAVATGEVTLSITVLIEAAAPAHSRRVELEINGRSRHVARLRFRSLGSKQRPMVLRFKGRARFDATDLPLTIEARPIRQIRHWEDADSVARYGALPFRLLDAEMRSERGR